MPAVCVPRNDRQLQWSVGIRSLSRNGDIRGSDAVLFSDLSPPLGRLEFPMIWFLFWWVVLSVPFALLMGAMMKGPDNEF